MNTQGKARKRLSAQVHYHIMAVPAVVWLVLFNIVPMFGIVMAFQDYNPAQGYFGST